MDHAHTIWFRSGCPDHLAAEVEAGDITSVGPDFDERSQASIVIAGGEPYNAEVLDSLPDLRAVVRVGIGTDAVDFAACTERGVAVANTPAGPTTSTAEHAIALMMSVAHQVPASAARLARGEGTSIVDFISVQRSMELNGRTLGLVGSGRIGSAVASIAQAIGMTVVVNDPAHPDSISLDDLLAQADVVSLHIPATPETMGLFNASTFAKMRPGSVLINCARGQVVVTDDLVAALESGHLMGAGLDCTEPEPLAPDHRLLQMDNVIVTPHVASSTIAGRQRMERMAFEQAVMVLAGKQPTELRNPDVLEHPRWKDS